MDTNDTPYCRLYIDTNESRDAVQKRLDSLVTSKFGQIQVLAAVSKNHGYTPARRTSKPYDPIEASQWTAELDAEDCSSRTFEAFEAGISAMIMALREGGLVVTASCDFEDRVAVETGWNWTSASPEPPE